MQGPDRIIKADLADPNNNQQGYHSINLKK